MKDNLYHRNGFISVGAGFTLMFLCGVAYSYGVAMPFIRDSFQLSTAQASLPFSAILVAYTLGIWLGGIFQDRIGATRACLLGAILFGLGFGATGLMPGFLTLLITYGLICGFGIGVSYIAATTTAVRWFPQRRGLAAGCVILGFGLGALILAPLKHWLITTYDWRAAFLILGGVFFSAGSILALLIRAPRKELTPTAEDAVANSNDYSTRQMIRTPTFRRLWLAWALSLCAGLGWMAHLASKAELSGISAALAAWTLSAVALANGFSRPLAGALADKIGRLPTLAAACGIFTFVGLFMLLPIDGGWRFFVVGIIFGACFGTLLVNYSPLAVELYGNRNFGSNLGILFTSYGMGALTGPALFGALYDFTGSYDAVIIASIALTLAAVYLFLSARKVQAATTPLAVQS